MIFEKGKNIVFSISLNSEFTNISHTVPPSIPYHLLLEINKRLYFRLYFHSKSNSSKIPKNKYNNVERKIKNKKMETTITKKIILQQQWWHGVGDGKWGSWEKLCVMRFPIFARATSVRRLNVYNANAFEGGLHFAQKMLLLLFFIPSCIVYLFLFFLFFIYESLMLYYVLITQKPNAVLFCSPILYFINFIFHLRYILGNKDHIMSSLKMNLLLFFFYLLP